MEIIKAFDQYKISDTYNGQKVFGNVDYLPDGGKRVYLALNDPDSENQNTINASYNADPNNFATISISGPEDLLQDFLDYFLEKVPTILSSRDNDL